MKEFNGKAIYKPKGKAGEYAEWACNFYVGCSNGCTYCYCKKGILAKVMGQGEAQLKKCFKDEEHALEVFEKELLRNKEALQKHGLFFSFTTDPFLDLTMDLTLFAMKKCLDNEISVKILTKNAENPLFALVGCFGIMMIGGVMPYYFSEHRNMIAIGFTLTGHDELEPNASTNQERIEAMKKLHEAGYKTFASIEPIVDFDSSLKMIRQTVDFCDLHKIGFMSGQKYDREELVAFMAKVHQAGCNKIYWKDSIRDFAQRANQYPSNCVERDYNLFND
jgi:DNA repair photolyase